jgi:H+/Cl- antiporter ClcA
LLFAPLGGFLVSGCYQLAGSRVAAGMNELIAEVRRPVHSLPLLLAPVIFLATLLTHLVGGSAGREGTAVQMGGALADVPTYGWKFRPAVRALLVRCGMAAGFASLFNTPLAGVLFAFEVVAFGRLELRGLASVMLAAYGATFVCHAWGVHHTVYTLVPVPHQDTLNAGYALLVGVLAGLAARGFINVQKRIEALVHGSIAPLWTPVVGGLLLAGLYVLPQVWPYLGLSIPMIQAAFEQPAPPEAWVLKLLLTAFTLGMGFKGGEVTPLFCIGAVLGSALAGLLPLPVSLLAAMGFTAVFVGATNTILAGIVLSVETFGGAVLPYTALACLAAWFVSGRTGIYSRQTAGVVKGCG